MKAEVVKLKDYRNTSYKEVDFSIGTKKDEFMIAFRKSHIRAWHIYSYVNDKTSDYNKQFRHMYHDKCVYCGISTQIISSSNFEVDHVIPKVVLEMNQGHDKKVIHGINNLVNSCQMCNRGKQGFICEDETQLKLHPDNSQLPNIFSRSSDFSIEIAEEYTNDEIIKSFYKFLKMGNQLRRLDYLIMEMKDFCEKYEGELIDEICNLIYKIESNRRKNH